MTVKVIPCDRMVHRAYETMGRPVPELKCNGSVTIHMSFNPRFSSGKCNKCNKIVQVYHEDVCP